MGDKLTFDQLIEWAYECQIEILFDFEAHARFDNYSFTTQIHNLPRLRFTCRNRSIEIVSNNIDDLLGQVFERRNSIFVDLRCPEWKKR
jgi:hypothetical protein